MRYIFISLIFLFSGCLFYLFNNQVNFFVEEKTIDMGQVLGASEAVAEEDIVNNNLIFNNLPQNNDAKEIIPEKICEENYNLEDSLAVVIDTKSKAVLYSKDSEKQVSIASITKLMTALVFLDYSDDWNKVYEVKKSDRREGGRIYLYTGDKVTIKDLFNLSLVGSANTATIALVNSIGLTEQEFVEKMNLKAVSLGLENTYFVDPIGLSYENISSASEVAGFASIALAQVEISDATSQKSYTLITQTGRKRIIYNTDNLVYRKNEEVKIIGGKTGFTNMAGYCFVGKFKNQEGQEIISVILNNPSKNGRFQETERLVDWVYDNYKW